MTFDKDTPDRIYATPSQEWSPFAGEPAVEYIKASKVQALVEALEKCLTENNVHQIAREALAAFKEGR